MTRCPGALLTPEDLVRLPDNKLLELIDGVPVAKRSGAEASYVGGEITGRLHEYLEAHPSGWVFGPTAGFRGFPNRPSTVRKPDVSFVRFGRFPDGRIPKGDIPLLPDLAVEVVSPNDTYDEVDRKVSDYLDGGVPLVWVVNPEAATAVVYRPDGDARRLRENDTLDGGDVLPGFRCRLGDLLPPPAEPTSAPTEQPAS